MVMHRALWWYTWEVRLPWKCVFSLYCSVSTCLSGDSLDLGKWEWKSKLFNIMVWRPKRHVNSIEGFHFIHSLLSKICYFKSPSTPAPRADIHGSYFCNENMFYRCTLPFRVSQRVGDYNAIWEMLQKTGEKWLHCVSGNLSGAWTSGSFSSRSCHKSSFCIKQEVAPGEDWRGGDTSEVTAVTMGEDYRISVSNYEKSA